MHGQREGDREGDSKKEGKIKKTKQEDRCGKRVSETGKRWLKQSVQAHRCASLQMCNVGRAGIRP